MRIIPFNYLFCRGHRPKGIKYNPNNIKINVVCLFPQANSYQVCASLWSTQEKVTYCSMGTTIKNKKELGVAAEQQTNELMDYLEELGYYPVYGPETKTKAKRNKRVGLTEGLQHILLDNTNLI